jgi:hypothetical protein
MRKHHAQPPVQYLEYKNKTFQFVEILTPEERDYYYEIPIFVEGEAKEVIITSFGIAIYSKDESCMLLKGIRPTKFSRRNYFLTKEQLREILSLVENADPDAFWSPETLLKGILEKKKNEQTEVSQVV